METQWARFSSLFSSPLPFFFSSWRPLFVGSWREIVSASIPSQPAECLTAADEFVHLDVVCVVRLKYFHRRATLLGSSHQVLFYVCIPSRDVGN